jgi:hypothetical protein
MTREELKAIYEKSDKNNSDYFSTLENGYAILQTNLETPWKFRDFDDVVTITGKEPQRTDYNMLYTVDIDKDALTVYGSYIDIANAIFLEFNRPDRPNIDNGYYGTSLSVSDIIIIKIANKTRVYYVEGFGFKELENFVVD